MKKRLILIMMCVVMMTMSACAKAQEPDVQEKTRAVQVEEVKSTKNPVALSYVGTVDSKDIVDYSFKSGGRIARMYVEEGDRVSRGDLLAQLDTQDINFQLSAATANMNSVQENIKKAKDQLEYSEQQLEKMDSLQKSGGISKDQLDQVRLQRDIARASYNQANSQYESARADYSYKQTLLEESSIYAKQDGIVADIAFEEGERVGPSASIVTLRSMNQIVNIGLAQGDLNDIKAGLAATVDVDGKKASGIVESIDEVPDMATRTYKAQIRVNDGQYRLGMIAKVSIDVGEKQGVWVPMQSIFSDGENYVYIVDKDRAFKRTVQMMENHEDKVMVSGVDSGELLAVSGMKNLNDGSKVNIVEQGE